ncbi:MAG: transglycosylase SLT domain-containing protein [Pseudomonadota bacterium]
MPSEKKAVEVAGASRRGLTPELDRMIDDISNQHGVDSSIVKGLIKAESNFDPQAKGANGASGLMQVMPDTAKKMGASNVFDAADNLGVGVRYLKGLIERFGKVEVALAAYLRGPRVVSEEGHVKDEGARGYVERVLRYSKAYRQAAEVFSGDVVSSESARE